jgi:hypothetical protein
MSPQADFLLALIRWSRTSNRFTTSLKIAVKLGSSARARNSRRKPSWADLSSFDRSPDFAIPRCSLSNLSCFFFEEAEFLAEFTCAHDSHASLHSARRLAEISAATRLRNPGRSERFWDKL